jgi:hypothetical protein
MMEERTTGRTSMIIVSLGLVNPAAKGAPAPGTPSRALRPRLA